MDNLHTHWLFSANPATIDFSCFILPCERADMSADVLVGELFDLTKKPVRLQEAWMFCLREGLSSLREITV
jgi:hypothetical protein